MYIIESRGLVQLIKRIIPVLEATLLTKNTKKSHEINND